MRRSPTIRQIFIYAAVLLVLLAIIIAPQRSRNTIRLHDDQIELQKLTNAITEIIIEEGYGYEVELVEATIKEARNLLVRGDIDITLELWIENNLLWHSQATQDETISDLGEMYSGGQQYWIVSRWYAEKHNIKTVFDMKNHWQDFQDPDDPSKGLFFNCIYGWTCRDINRVKLQAYDLDRYYNIVSPVSPKSLKSIYENAQTSNFPVFGYYWEPNSLMTKGSWHVLEEPAFSKDVWIEVIEAASSPNGKRLERACAYNDSGAHKIVSSKLSKKAPEVYKMLEKMRIDIVFFNEIFLNREILKNQNLTPREMAIRYLKDYPDQWTKWVNDKAEKQILTSLEDSLLLEAEGR